jgi:tRNA dimethylallyltransferase
VLIVLAGPSGVGKSALAVALAERFGGEVIGADSMQVYRGLDSGTAKPAAEFRERVAHHMIDCVEPDRDYSAGDYVRDADVAIQSVAARGHVPVVAGGTGLYLRALLRGIVSVPRRQPELRARLNRIVGKRGPGVLRRILVRRDPETARSIATGDRQRLVRAVEVALSGKDSLARLIHAHGFAEDRYRAVRVGVDMPEELLLPRLERRVHDMFTGERLQREVEGLLSSGLRADANALRALGYREVLACRRGEFPAAELEERTLRNTRRYVKRQRTWFRKEKGFRWFRLSGDTAKDLPPIETWVATQLQACARTGG